MHPADAVRELAFAAGFDPVGLVPLRPPADAERFERWLAAGRHAEMGWLERSRERIADPRRIDARARTLLVVGAGHGRPAVRLEGGGRVARYAAGRDYHNVLTKRLRRLGRELEGLGLAGRGRAIVDAGPLLERSHAAEAGLGFLSKAANLLHADHGPWFFLGELLLDVEFEPTAGPAPGSCGTCTACIDACPTGALVGPGELDANLCLSYHTIENRGAVPHELRASIGDWVFGCDVCSEICPWGEGAEGGAETFGTHPAVEGGSLVRWLGLDGARHAAELRGSPLRRPRREGLARNAALVLGNRPSEAGRGALQTALEEHDGGWVRASAFWALARGHLSDVGVRPALERALAREAVTAVRADMACSLALLA